MSVETPEVSAPTLSLRDFLAVLARRKKTALLVFALVLGAILTLTLLTPATYFSSSRLLLEPQDTKSAGGADPVSQIFNRGGNADIENQIQLLTSPLITDQVYREAGLEPNSVKVNAERVPGGSNAIEITATSESQVGATKFLETLPEVYRGNRRNDRLQEVTTQLEFAQRDLDSEAKKLDDLERNWTEWKNRRGIVDIESEATEALSALSQSRSALDAARAGISSLQAQIAALRGQLETLPRFLETPVTTTNPQLEELRVQLADLQSARTQLEFRYKPNADPMRENARQIRDMEARIARTPATVTTTSRAPNPVVAETQAKIAGARADLQAQQAAAAVLQNQIARQEQGLTGFTQIQREGAQLLRQLEATRESVKAGAIGVRELTQRSKAMDAVGSPLTVLRPAGTGYKIAPNLKRSLVIALFLGALLACAAAFVQDSLDDSVHGQEQARQLLGAPVLGQFPLTALAGDHQILDLQNPDRVTLETFRALRSNVYFALAGSRGKKLQITSSVPNEGKSYIASNLAITMALDGKRVILVDADLHRPTMHERLDRKRQPGLSNVLVGEVALQDALQDGGTKGLRLLSAGALPPNPAELLNSPAMEALLREMENMADLILIDTPPLLATSDSQLLSAKMDGVVFVMQVGSTPRSGTLRAQELLKQANANLIGVVFNKVKTGKNAGYEYYSGYYTLNPTPPEDQSEDGQPRSLHQHSNGSGPGEK